MPTTVNGLRLRKTLGRQHWTPPQPFGPDGWKLVHRNGESSVIVTTSDHPGWPGTWTHASISHLDRTPTYDELVLLKRAVWGSTGWAMQVFPPSAEHVNIHEYALHLWGPADGRRPEGIPDFGRYGTI